MFGVSFHVVSIQLLPELFNFPIAGNFCFNSLQFFISTYESLISPMWDSLTNTVNFGEDLFRFSTRD